MDAAPAGLTSAQAAQYQHAHGYNELIEHKDSLALVVLKRAATPISAMLVAAAALSFVSGKPFDGFFILALLVINVAITVWQEHKADTAIAQLNEHIAAKVKVRRDGMWQTLPARFLVPGDVIELRAGSVVPADAKVTAANAASANEAALTGESLSKDKAVADTLYSGSFIASGLLTAHVTATGADTFFGKTIMQVDASGKKSALERQILRISKLLSGLALAAAVLLTWLLVAHGASLLEVLRLDLSLVIAGIPVSLPAVMTFIIALGTVTLARRGAVVRRLSSLEELANADYLLTDKTGTLTKNEITVDSIELYGSATQDEALRLAAAIAQNEPDVDINRALLTRAGAQESPRAVGYTPADSTRKRATAVIDDAGRRTTLSIGAPQVVAALCALAHGEQKRFDAAVEAAAARGYRALALAQGEGEGRMELVALFSLSDALRDDAGEVIQFLGQNGVGVSMVTGDNRAIAQEIARKLNIPGANILTPQSRPAGGWGALSKADFEQAQAFAEILPDDKYALVMSAKRFYTVASNGDGINDLPAVRAANIGFAVKNAVDALKGAADIVLLTDGIAVMQGAFIEGRKIFMRLWVYSVYRISESFRLIATIAVLGLLVGTYPLSPLQLILLALLNDIPIISLAGNRVEVAEQPATLNVRKQFTLSLLFGAVGIASSLLLYAIARWWLMLPIPLVQTIFFLKLTVSGHFLIYVAHTRKRWWRYLPSPSVILATGATQLVATLLALSGFLMSAALPWPYVALAWVWSFVFMQVTEWVKWLVE